MRAERRPSLYFVSAPVDFALIGGASIATYLGLRLFHDGTRTETIWTLSALLVWVVNWPHFAATSQRLYRSRAHVAQYPVTALGIPLLLAAAVVGAFRSPEGVAPWLVKAFMLWSPYHFSGQSVGISLLYARRAGFPIGRAERLALSGFVFGTFLVQSALAETGQGHAAFYSVEYPTLGLPLLVPQLLRIWMWLCGAAFLVLAARTSLREKRMLPAIVLLPGITQFVWFVLGWRVPAFNEFVPFFHALQYLLVAWMMQLGESAGGRVPASPRRFVAAQSARFVLFNVAGGAFLFWLLPQIGARAGYGLPFASAVVLSAVQIHHFVVDGVIWKLKNPRVASPLMATLGDLWSRKEAPPAPEVLRAA